MSKFVGIGSSEGENVPLAAFVENIDANTVRVCAAPGYELAVFKAPGRGYEVAVVGDNDTWRLKIKQPGASQTVAITFPEPNVLQIQYGVTK